MTGSTSPSPLVMWRETLTRIPSHEFPPGYEMRPFQPGEQQLWADIQDQADELQRIEKKHFFASFGDSIAEHRERIFFLQHPSGQEIGSIAAWYGDEPAEPKSTRPGRIHWVAILPDHQRKGLSKPMMTFVLEKLRELGHDRAYLTTDAARRKALDLYRQFQFEEA